MTSYITQVEFAGGVYPDKIDFEDIVKFRSDIDSESEKQATVQELLTNPSNYFEGQYSREDIFARLRENVKMQGNQALIAKSIWDYLEEIDSPLLQEPIFNPENLPSVRKTKRFIQNKYGLKINIVREDQTVDTLELEGYSHARDRLAFDLLELKNDIQKLPPGFFKSLGIQVLFFSDSILKDDEFFAGIIPSIGHNFYLSRTFPFHHELFHRIDYIAGGGIFSLAEMMVANPYSSLTNQIADEKNNKVWAELNMKANFTCASSKKGCSYNEEQAEYARILLNLDDPRVYRYQYKPKMEYPAGQAKFAKMKEWFKEWSNGVMDEGYWVDLQEGRIDENYWS